VTPLGEPALVEGEVIAGVGGGDADEIESDLARVGADSVAQGR
jgi:hypothetical protein